jgi:hypothetical protein
VVSWWPMGRASRCRYRGRQRLAARRVSFPVATPAIVENACDSRPAERPRSVGFSRSPAGTRAPLAPAGCGPAQRACRAS